MKKKSPHNRRKHQRIKVDKNLKIPVHLFPVLPFLGHSIEADLLNISAGGMALAIHRDSLTVNIKRLQKVNLHFRLPGSTLAECRAVITHRYKYDEDCDYLGIRFTQKPLTLSRVLHQMTFDNDMCDRRIQEMPRPWCDSSCSYMPICCKPLKKDQAPFKGHGTPLEITLTHPH